MLRRILGTLCGAKAAMMLATLLALSQFVPAQTFTIIHNFDNRDGRVPWQGVVMDRAGNLYGVTQYGGWGDGNVYRLRRVNGAWLAASLYEFPAGGLDGNQPATPITIGPDGVLYGATSLGGQNDLGLAFSLRPSASRPVAVLPMWTETVLHTFAGGTDGASPSAANLLVDESGNVYGVTPDGGIGTGGTVFELTPSAEGWVETILHSFTGQDGYQPLAGLISDSAGNLYGTTSNNVYELSPSDMGWTEQVLYTFGDGIYPRGSLLFDRLGNLYGTTYEGGPDDAGTVFELTPSNGGWTYQLLYAFTGNGGPWGGLVSDAQGNLYGTTFLDGQYRNGSVFKLTRSGDGWLYTDLHDFPGGHGGSLPAGTLVIDSSGNLYGTTGSGGAYGGGTVYEISP